MEKSLLDISGVVWIGSMDTAYPASFLPCNRQFTSARVQDFGSRFISLPLRLPSGVPHNGNQSDFDLDPDIDDRDVRPLPPNVVQRSHRSVFSAKFVHMASVERLIQWFFPNFRIVS
jgi:hypothetical protein